MHNEVSTRTKFVTLFARSLAARVDHVAHHRKMLFVLVILPVLFAVLMPIVASITVFAVYALALSEALISLYLFMQVTLEDSHAVDTTLAEIYNAHPEYRTILLHSADAQWADATPSLA